jgi:hypothetical protein
MNRRQFIAPIGLSAPPPAQAQAQRPPILGLLSSSTLADWAMGPFREGPEQGGHVEGSQPDHHPPLCGDPVRPFDIPATPLSRADDIVE